VAEVTENDLKNWKMLDVFQKALDRAFSQSEAHPTFQDPRRQLGYAPYLSLFLFGLFNPVVESMRGLCSISALPRVQKEISRSKVSLGSFSETQAVIEPTLLQEVFKDIAQQIQTRGQRDPRLEKLNLVLQDGSLWPALPRMAWAEYGVGPKGQAKGVRLHLRFNLVEDKPLEAKITRGKSCERQALLEMCQPGQTNVGDRYYGGDYHYWRDIDQAGGFFVFRIRDHAIIHVEEELPISPADQKAGVVRHCWARLGANTQSMRVRVVEVRTADQHLLLVTNLALEKAPADLISLIYRKRWAIELFFRWVKCILGCRHFFAESPRGVAIQLYLALIASLLFQFYTGQRPNKRIMELIHFYQLGWATEEDLITMLKKLSAKPNKKKTS
jgi:hypothetical protein